MLRTVKDRRDSGRALRKQVPRSSHAEFTRHRSVDAVELLLSQDKGRIESLIPVRHGRMSESAFAFYRAGALLMATDLATTRDSPYEHDGERFVQGQRLMQSTSDILLGLASNASGHHYYVRQFKDMKASPRIEKFDPDDMIRYASVCGAVRCSPMATPAVEIPPRYRDTSDRATPLPTRSQSSHSRTPVRTRRTMRHSSAASEMFLQPASPLCQGTLGCGGDCVPGGRHGLQIR